MATIALNPIPELEERLFKIGKPLLPTNILLHTNRRSSTKQKTLI
jgi:hypothetical protein